MTISDATRVNPPTDALLRISQAIEAAITLDELLLLAVSELTSLFGMARGALVLFGEKNNASEHVMEFPPQTAPSLDLHLTRTPELHQVLSERQPLHVQQRAHNGTSTQLDVFLRERSIGSALLVPLIAQDRALGVLLLGATSRARRFSANTIGLARVLAGQVASAIVAFRINDAARMRNEELRTLHELADAITSTLDPHEIYRMIIKKINEYFDVDAGSILLMDEASGDLTFVMTIEHGQEQILGMRVPVGQGVVGHVAQTGQWEIVPDVERDPRFYRKISEDVGYITHSILCVPMAAKGRVIGVIELLNKLKGPFTTEDAERLMRMAAFIGVAIENARLFQEIAAGRDRLAMILNSTADGFVTTDEHDIVRSVNPMATEIFQAHERELVGRTLMDLLAELHQRAHEVITRDWSNGEQNGDSSQVETVTEMQLGGQQRRFIRHISLPIRDTSGAVYGELAVFRDITKERELDQLRDDYTGMLVHDLRAPLTSIMNGILMVRRGLGGPVNEQQKELLDIAQQGSQNMLEAVNTLLDISKMEQGRLVVEVEPLIPYTLTDAATERLAALAQARRVKIAQRLAVGLPPVEAERDKIVRVLQNLLDNALKFSPSGGTVVVGIDALTPNHPLPDDVPHPPTLGAGHWMIFWVQDDGPGIPAVYHERIFEKFGQVRGHKLRGTGLGLTFCKLVIETHGGQIWLDSAEGKGSTFAFALPLIRD